MEQVEYGELTVVQKISGETHTITGKIRKPVIENKADYESINSWSAGPIRLHNADRYLFSAEFVPDPDTGCAYTIRKSETKATAVLKSAEIEVENETLASILDAQKRVGAPDTAVPSVSFYPKRGNVAKFVWEEYV